jgi:hypothetical protein
VLFSVVGTYGGACSELNNKSRGEIGDVIISLDTSSLNKRKKYEIYHQKVNKHKKKMAASRFQQYRRHKI